jgi:hypothetical protein
VFDDGIKNVCIGQVCREESHADQFIKGLLYMKRLRYFQQLEASEKSDGRPDAREAIVSWHQPDRTELILTFPGVEPLKLGQKGFGCSSRRHTPFLL